MKVYIGGVRENEEHHVRVDPGAYSPWLGETYNNFARVGTWDKGQQPQRGGWIWARHGKGHYTYFAYAFHRQLPHGVSGAYRLLANILSLNKRRPAAKAASR